MNSIIRHSLRDGFVTAKEADDIRNESTKATIKLMDRNHDGLVSFREFLFGKVRSGQED